MKTIRLLICLSLFPGGMVLHAAELQWEEKAGQSIALKSGDQILWQLHYDADASKPYFDPVAMPGGESLTWHAPPDHPWHLGFWFSWKYINGVNFWEYDATGTSPGKTECSNVRFMPADDFSARLEMDLAYRLPDGNVAMTEKRTIAVTPPDASGMYRFDWTMTFSAGQEPVELNRTPLPGEPGGQPWGGYAGLSLRLAKDLTERAAVSSEGPIEFNNEDRYRGRADAMDYAGQLGGRAVGATVLDHPRNMRHPTPWYVIRSPEMSYVNPAIISFEPLALPAGESFTLRYRVIVHPDRWDAERLKVEYQRYAEGK